MYQKYAEQGYTSTKTRTYNGDDGAVHTKVHTYWTQKGRLFIYDLLKTNGILPLIEKMKARCIKWILQPEVVTVPRLNRS